MSTFHGLSLAVSLSHCAIFSLSTARGSLSAYPGLWVTTVFIKNTVLLGIKLDLRCARYMQNMNKFQLHLTSLPSGPSVAWGFSFVCPSKISLQFKAKSTFFSLSSPLEKLGLFKVLGSPSSLDKATLHSYLNSNLAISLASVHRVSQHGFLSGNSSLRSCFELASLPFPLLSPASSGDPTESHNSPSFTLPSPAIDNTLLTYFGTFIS